MSWFSLLKKALKDACYGFFCLTMLYSLIMLVLYQGKDAGMSVTTVLLFYPLSCLLSFVGNWMQQKKWGIVTKAAILYATAILGIGLFVFLPHNTALTGGSLLILFALITIAYLFGFAIFWAIWAPMKKKENKNQEYSNVYKKENNK